MSKLAFFPTPYPDEDFRSIILRYRQWTEPLPQSVPVHKITPRLLGMVTSRLPAFPHNIDFLSSQLPEDLSSNYFIMNHTYLPLEATISSSSMVMKQYALMRNNSSDSIASNAYHKFITSDIRWCPYCIEEDLDRHGEAYIHRIHQIKYLDVCVYHGTHLLAECPMCHEEVVTPKGRFDVHQGYCRNGHSLTELKPQQSNSPTDTLKQKLAEDVLYIFEHPDDFSFEYSSSRFKAFLWENGYITETGMYKNKLFTVDLINEYPESTLISLGINAYHRKNFFPNGLVKLQPDLRNFLMENLIGMRFVTGTAKDFLNSTFEEISRDIPYGNGPWICRNPVCPDFQQSIILYCTRENVRKKPYGKWAIRSTFTCPTCEYTYVGDYCPTLDRQPSHSFRTVSYGPIWEQELIRIYSETGSFSQTATRLNVGDETAKSHIIRLSNDDPFGISAVTTERFSVEWIIKAIEVYEQTQSTREVAKQMNVAKQTMEKIERKMNLLLSQGVDIQEAASEVSATMVNTNRTIEAREVIFRALEKDQNITREQIRWSDAYKHLVWLRRHDLDWLDRVLPPKKTSERRKIDWSTVDQEICTHIRNAAKALYMEDVPQQITPSLIRKRLPTRALSRIKYGRSKLPLSQSLLRELSESRSDSLIRLIPHYANVIRSRGLKVTIASILNIPKYKRCSDDVKEKVEQYVGGSKAR